jgi:hypothetical protein
MKIELLRDKDKQSDQLILQIDQKIVRYWNVTDFISVEDAKKEAIKFYDFMILLYRNPHIIEIIRSIEI